MGIDCWQGSTMNSKLWAILHDLEIIQIKIQNKVIIETDCMLVAEMNNDYLKSTLSMTLVKRIKEVSRQLSLLNSSL